jgi:hypothetical protein
MGVRLPFVPFWNYRVEPRPRAKVFAFTVVVGLSQIHIILEITNVLAHYHTWEYEVKEERGRAGPSSQLGMPHGLQLQVSEACFCCIICSIDSMGLGASRSMKISVGKWVSPEYKQCWRFREIAFEGGRSANAGGARKMIFMAVC